MIRIKCPTCAEVQTLDDEEAGQTGVCADCGAKFRIPAKKSATPARPGKKDEGKRSAARSQRDEEDEDDDIEDEDEEKPAKKAGKPRKGKSGMTTGHMAMAAGFLVAVILLTVGGYYINLLGIFVGSISGLLMLTCSLMVAREALSESGGKFILVLIVPFMFFIENWERTKRIFFAYITFLILTLVGVGGYFLHEMHLEAKRIKTKDELKKLESGALGARMDQVA